MKTTRTYVFVFVPVSEQWVVPAPRVLAMASSPLGTSLDWVLSLHIPEQTKYYFGGTQKPTRQTRALPDNLFWTWFVGNPRPGSKLS